MSDAITWAERVRNLRKALGREPSLSEKLEAASIHQMTPAEVEAQRQSWVRAFTTGCEHGALDFEQCEHCRANAVARAALARTEDGGRNDG